MERTIVGTADRQRRENLFLGDGDIEEVAVGKEHLVAMCLPVDRRVLYRGAVMKDGQRRTRGLIA